MLWFSDVCDHALTHQNNHQNNPATQAIPVILLTAKVQPLEQSQYAQLGIAGLIAKPFDPVQIGQQIAHILGWN